MIRITICGIAGRMGRELIGAAHEYPDIKIAAGLEISGHALIGKAIEDIPVYDDIRTAVRECDCVIDFTNHRAALSTLQYLLSEIRPFVSGSTGFSEKEFDAINEISRRVPVFVAPNMSLGINALYELVRRASGNLPEFDIEIIETHHRSKKDAPSGTAKEMINIIRANRPDIKIVSERNGTTGGRESGEMGVFAIRGGDVVGEHRVLFLGSGEFIELRHYATSRRCFARGALTAARFMIGRKSGLYTMADLLNV